LANFLILMITINRPNSKRPFWRIRKVVCSGFIVVWANKLELFECALNKAKAYRKRL
jgi:hypothetical protein